MLVYVKLATAMGLLVPIVGFCALLLFAFAVFSSSFGRAPIAVRDEPLDGAKPDTARVALLLHVPDGPTGPSELSIFCAARCVPLLTLRATTAPERTTLHAVNTVS